MMPPNPTPDLPRVAAEALQEVLSTQFHCAAAPASDGDLARAAGEGAWLTGCVGLTAGTLTGSLRLQLPERWLRRLHASLGGGGNASPADDGDLADLADLAGELCNMMAGRIAARLSGGGASMLGTPVVARGRLPEPEAGLAGPSGRSCWTCAGQVLTLDLTLGSQAP